MSKLRVCLFGTMQITNENGRSLRMTPTTQSLFAYLLLFRNQIHRRDVLINLFWKERPDDKARRCLSTTLWRLNKSLVDELPIDVQIFDTSMLGEIRFEDSDQFWIDTFTFETNAAQGLEKPLSEMGEREAILLEEAVSLYRGDLLEGYYEDWVFQERERLNLLYLRCLGRLMAYYWRAKEWRASILYGQKILQIDPLREQIHRDLMQMYLESGQRPLAIQQYHQCSKILDEELSVAPMPDTTNLYRQIMGDSTTPLVSSIAPTQSVDQLLEQIQQAMHDLEHLRASLLSFQEQNR